MRFSVVLQLAILGTAAASPVINSTTTSTAPTQTGGPFVSCTTQYSQCMAGGGNNCDLLQTECIDSCFASLQQCSYAKGAACQVDFAACAGTNPPSPAPTAPVANCTQRYSQCMAGGANNCDTLQTECLNSCYNNLQICNTAGGAACQVDYAACAGNPIVVPSSTSSATSSPTDTSCSAQQSQCEASGGANCALEAQTCVGKCEGIGYTCEMVHGPNCQASYAACVGPALMMMSNSTLGPATTTTTTQIVGTLTTVCPAGSTISVNGHTWSAGSVPLTLTVTDCPCTITSAVSATTSATATTQATSTQSIAHYTGAAVANGVMGGSVGVVVVAIAAML